MCILRYFYGVILGYCIPLSYVMVSEISIAKLRGRLNLIITCFYSIGKLFCVFLMMIFLDDFSKGNWRGLLLSTVFIAFICFLNCLFILSESARFLISHNRYC